MTDTLDKHLRKTDTKNIVVGKYKKNAIVGLGIAAVAMILMTVINTVQHSPLLNWVGLTGFFFLIWGHYNLAKAKKYSGWLTLLTFLFPIGLIILFILPTKK